MKNNNGKNSVGIVIGAAVALLIGVSAGAQTPQRLPASRTVAPATSFPPGQEAEIKGLIISRDGDDMLVRDEAGKMNVVTLTADTRITSPSGPFKMDKKQRDVTNLLPGLIVKVDGAGGDRGNLVAGKISFHSSALRVAEQISAGDVMTEREIKATQDSVDALKARVDDSLAIMNSRTRDSLAAISARFDDIDKYDARDSATVLFATGSAALTADARRQLDGIASKGMSLSGYLVEVTGFTDGKGSASSNQRLSERRAEAVVAYLSQTGKVPLRRILNPTGFGETDPVASNASASGRTMNRRAEVRILVNRARR